MSAKYTLIFALAALCCLVVSTESAAQRSRVLSSRRGSELVEKTSDNQEEFELAAQEHELQRQEQEEHNDKLEGRSDDLAAGTDNKQDKETATNKKDTIVKPNKDDARARRIVRAGRRRGGRRGGRRAGRRSVRRGGRRGGRRRGGRRGRAGARRRTSIKRRSGKGNKA
ncbi:protein nemuri [Drosophila teissieri]|uniref:protein nemuri n=1 Tax=Drosophila teissieri TaxID=7243 RepID=UPI001CBA538B|nr:protein nemuri [Drosophila teissieri]